MPLVKCLNAFAAGREENADEVDKHGLPDAELELVQQVWHKHLIDVEPELS